jgi:hypothetical protein
VRDNFGTEIEVGDIVFSASTATGRAKLGQVYAFDHNGWPMVKHPGKEKSVWKKSSAGFHVLVLQKGADASQPYGLYKELLRDYEREVPE